MIHSNGTNEQKRHKDRRRNNDWNKLKHQSILVFVLFPLKLHSNRTHGETLATGSVLESL